MNASGITTAFIGNHTEWNVSTQEMTRYYLAGGQRIAFRVIKSGQADKVFYLLADHLGSTNVVMQVGGVVETKTYTAWGKDRTGSISKTDRQYTGQINESELGLYFYNARYYDPDLGRFTSADTIVPQPGNPQDWDRYAYVRNNPVNYNDPSGHRAVEGCGDEGKSACTASPQELAAYEYWRQRQQHLQCQDGESLYCSPFGKIPEELEKLDKDLSMDLQEELELPQYQSLLENKYTPVVFGGISVLATDAMYVSMILVPKSPAIFTITVGATYLTARLSGIVSSVSTGYQYKHNLYGTTENDVRISAATTIISAWPKPDMGFVNHIGFLYTIFRTFGVIESP